MIFNTLKEARQALQKKQHRLFLIQKGAFYMIITEEEMHSDSWSVKKQISPSHVSYTMKDGLKLIEITNPTLTHTNPTEKQ